MSRKYKFGEKEGAYFVSFATVNWIDVFTRVDYFDCIIESLDFCRKNKLRTMSEIMIKRKIIIIKK